MQQKLLAVPDRWSKKKNVGRQMESLGELGHEGMGETEGSGELASIF